MCCMRPRHRELPSATGRTVAQPRHGGLSVVPLRCGVVRRVHAPAVGDAEVRARDRPEPGDGARLATLGGEKVVSWEDFQTGLWHGEGRSETILDRPDNRPVALPILRSNVLKFRLESGAFAAFRPSGTEPKLKVYLQSRTDAALLDRMESEARALLGL